MPGTFGWLIASWIVLVASIWYAAFAVALATMRSALWAALWMSTLLLVVSLGLRGCVHGGGRPLRCHGGRSRSIAAPDERYRRCSPRCSHGSVSSSSRISASGPRSSYSLVPGSTRRGDASGRRFPRMPWRGWRSGSLPANPSGLCPTTPSTASRSRPGTPPRCRCGPNTSARDASRSVPLRSPWRWWSCWSEASGRRFPVIGSAYALTLYVAFKAGFVRQDEWHTPIALLAVAVVALVAAALFNVPAATLAPRTRTLAIAVVTAIAVVAWGLAAVPGPAQHVADIVRSSDETLAFFVRPGRAEASRRVGWSTALAEIRRKVPLPTRHGHGRSLSGRPARARRERR